MATVSFSLLFCSSLNMGPKNFVGKKRENMTKGSKRVKKRAPTKKIFFFFWFGLICFLIEFSFFYCVHSERRMMSKE